MSRAFEFAATPLLFGAAGFGLDSLFGIRPVLTIALAVFAVAGMFVRLWYGYDAEMREHEAKSSWSPTRAPRPVETPDTDVDLWDRRGPLGAER